MKNQMLNIILLLVLNGLFSSCKKDPPTKPICLYCNTDTSKIKPIWNVLNAPEFFGIGSMVPIITDQGVLFSTYFYKNKSEVIHLYDKTTGQLIWSWSEWLAPTEIAVSKIVNGDKLIIVDWENVYVINIKTGTTLWSHRSGTGKGSPRGWVAGDYIYHEEVDAVPNNSVSYLLRSKIEFKEWDTVLTFKRTNGYAPELGSFKLWIDSMGDSILVFQNRSWNFPQSDGKVDLYAYNLSTKKMKWFKEDIDPTGSCNVDAVNIVGNRCFFYSGSGFYCFNLINGVKIWEANDDKSNWGNLYFLNEKIYVQTNNQYFVCIDQNSGKELWRRSNTGSNTGPLEYYNNKFYCLTGNGLFCYSATDGKVLAQYKSPNEYRPTSEYARFSGVGDGGCPIDPITNRMYVADNHYVMCIKVPE